MSTSMVAATDKFRSAVWPMTENLTESGNVVFIDLAFTVIDFVVASYERIVLST